MKTALLALFLALPTVASAQNQIQLLCTQVVASPTPAPTATPIPTPVPTPMPTPVPVASLPGTIVFSDDFEMGNLAKSAGGFKWLASNAGSGDAVTVSQDVAHSGKYALKFTFGGDPLGADAWAEQRFDIGQNAQEVWMKWYQYFPNGTEGLGPKWVERSDSGPLNNKFFRLWDVDYNAYHLKVGASTWPANGDGTIFGEYGDDGVGVGSHGKDGNGPYAGEATGIINDANRGRWVEFKVHVKAASSANNDGVVELYVDGVKKISNGNLPMYPSGGVNNFFHYGYLMGWANTGFSETTNTYVDDFVLSVVK